MSSTDFCNRLSKKIAGAHNASARPAIKPTRFENSRAAARPSSTHDADPISAWMMRTIRRSRSKIA